MKILRNGILLLTFLVFCSCSKKDVENLIEEEIVNGKSVLATDLVQKFNDRELIFDQTFNILTSTDKDYAFQLSGGQDNQIHDFVIAKKQVDLSTLSSERVKILYTSFLTKKSFSFESTAVTITKIAHEDGSGGSLLVYAKTDKTKEAVSFYYSTKVEKQHWLDAPQ